jgi:hypothetical protein
MAARRKIFSIAGDFENLIVRTELAVDALDQRPPRSSAIADDSPR